jgi:hypothetical protein
VPGRRGEFEAVRDCAQEPRRFFWKGVVFEEREDGRFALEQAEEE